MRTSWIFVTVVASTISLSAVAQTGSTMSSGTASAGDANFVKTAAISDMYEIQASQLAQTKATSADVKTFADRMIADHTKTSDQLKSLVANKPGMTPPTSIDAKHRAFLAKLRSASGANFDTLYAQQQIHAHYEAVMLFTSESQKGKDSDLKNFASQTLPTLQQHLSMAQQLPKGGAASP
jgi:putative membrane protein